MTVNIVIYSNAAWYSKHGYYHLPKPWYNYRDWSRFRGDFEFIELQI